MARKNTSLAGLIEDEDENALDFYDRGDDYSSSLRAQILAARDPDIAAAQLMQEARKKKEVAEKTAVLGGVDALMRGLQFGVSPKAVYARSARKAIELGLKEGTTGQEEFESTLAKAAPALGAAGTLASKRAEQAQASGPDAGNLKKLIAINREAQKNAQRGTAEAVRLATEASARAITEAKTQLASIAAFLGDSFDGFINGLVTGAAGIAQVFGAQEAYKRTQDLPGFQAQMREAFPNMDDQQLAALTHSMAGMTEEEVAEFQKTLEDSGFAGYKPPAAKEAPAEAKEAPEGAATEAPEEAPEGAAAGRGAIMDLGNAGGGAFNYLYNPKTKEWSAYADDADPSTARVFDIQNAPEESRRALIDAAQEQIGQRRAPAEEAPAEEAPEGAPEGAPEEPAADLKPEDAATPDGEDVIAAVQEVVGADKPWATEPTQRPERKGAGPTTTNAEIEKEIFDLGLTAEQAETYRLQERAKGRVAVEPATTPSSLGAPWGDTRPLPAPPLSEYEQGRQAAVAEIRAKEAARLRPPLADDPALAPPGQPPAPTAPPVPPGMLDIGVVPGQRVIPRQPGENRVVDDIVAGMQAGATQAEIAAGTLAMGGAPAAAPAPVPAAAPAPVPPTMTQAEYDADLARRFPAATPEELAKLKGAPRGYDEYADRERAKQTEELARAQAKYDAWLATQYPAAGAAGLDAARFGSLGGTDTQGREGDAEVELARAQAEYDAKLAEQFPPATPGQLKKLKGAPQTYDEYKDRGYGWIDPMDPSDPDSAVHRPRQEEEAQERAWIDRERRRTVAPAVRPIGTPPSVAIEQVNDPIMAAKMFLNGELAMDNREEFNRVMGLAITGLREIYPDPQIQAQLVKQALGALNAP